MAAAVATLSEPILAQLGDEGHLAAGRQRRGTGPGPRGRAPGDGTVERHLGRGGRRRRSARRPRCGSRPPGRGRGLGGRVVPGPLDVALGPRATLAALASVGEAVSPTSHRWSTLNAAAVRRMAPTLNGDCTWSRMSPRPAGGPAPPGPVQALEPGGVELAAGHGRASLGTRRAGGRPCGWPGGRRSSPRPAASAAASRRPGASAPPAGRGRRRRAGQPGPSRSWSAAFPTRTGGFDHRPRSRTPAGTSSGADRPHVAEPGGRGVGPGQLERPLVDVDRPHGGARRPGRQRQRHRAVAAAEVDQVAGRAAAGGQQQHLGAGIDPAGREHAPVGAQGEGHVGQVEAHLGRARRAAGAGEK